MLDHSKLDYRPLSEAVARADVVAYKKLIKNSGSADVSVSTILRWIVVGFIGLIFVLVGGSVFAAFIAALASTNISTGPVNPAVFVMPMILLIVAAAIVVFIIRSSRGRWARRYRLDRFARANGLVARLGETDSDYPGSIFGIGSERTAYDSVRQLEQPYIDIANYRYTTGSGKNRTVHHWGYLAIRLDRRLPQMVLDARSNNGLFGGTNLPAVFSKNQVLKLEGDFDKYFTMYCPREYEQDALYVFTPDLMALLIDNADSFDVEIVDDWMFVYSSTSLKIDDPAVLRRMFTIVDTVGAKTLSQSRNYRDERAIPAGTPLADGFAASGNTIAAGGRRLHRGVSGGAIVFSVAILAFWAWSTFIAR
jgi:hypothetical protein